MSEQTPHGGNGELTGEPASRDDRRRLGNARERFARMAEQVRHAGQSTGDRARRGAERARERASVTGDTLRQGYSRAEERARVFSGDLNDFVQENPARAVLVAAGIGFLIGLLARRSD